MLLRANRVADNTDPFDDDDDDDDEAEDGFADFLFSDFTPQHTDPDSEGAFPPPATPIEVHCIHCGRNFSSSLMVKQWMEHTGEYAWCCPNESCDGIGFCFDIWPVDPDWRDEEGNSVHSDALPAHFPEERENCVWLEQDEDLMFEDEYRVGGYERQDRVDRQTDAFWPPGTGPKTDDPDKPFGSDDIPF